MGLPVGGLFHWVPARKALARFPLLLSLAVLGLALAACGSEGTGDEAASPTDAGYRGEVLTLTLVKPQVLLTDTSGSLFDFRAETEGYVTLLYFGYTNCPDICPSHMANIAAALARLPDDVSKQVKVVFVTVDPARDTAERLRQWLDLFDPSFIGLAGSLELTDATLRQALGELYFPITREDLGDGEYAVSHAAFVIAYTPDAFGHIVYPVEAQQEDYAHDLTKMVKEGWVQPSTGPYWQSSATTPAPEAQTPAGPAAQRPTRVRPEEAKKLLGTEFVGTTMDAVRESIDSAYEKHPDAERFISQGLAISRQRIDLDLRICGSRPERAPDDPTLLACSTLGACARLSRILYGHYIQSGYEEFYQAAANVYDYVATELPDEFQAFFFIVRSELRVSGLPSN